MEAAPLPYPKISIEGILSRDPEVIIDMSKGHEVTDLEIASIRSQWKQFPGIRAVQQDRVEVLGGDVLLVPGPRIAQAVQSLARAIHGAEAE